MMEETTLSSIPNQISTLLNRLRIRTKHINKVFVDNDMNIIKIILKEKRRMGSDIVFLDKENLRRLYRNKFFEGIGSPDIREGLHFIFSL